VQTQTHEQVSILPGTGGALPPNAQNPSSHLNVNTVAWLNADTLLIDKVGGLVEVPADGGQETPLLDAGGSPTIGAVSFPDGTFRAITNDTNNYTELSLSGDGQTIAAVQTQTHEQVSILPGTGGALPQSAQNLSAHLNANTVAWLSADILLIDKVSGLVEVPADGGQETPLLDSGGAPTLDADVCDGKNAIVFSWALRGGLRTVDIWRVNADGSNPQQLTKGIFAVNVTCSPDGKWVYFRDNQSAKHMRVPLEGGDPETIGGLVSQQFLVISPTLAVSPDGSLIAAVASFVEPERQGSVERLAVLRTDALSNPPKLFGADTHIAGIVRFTPDGKGIAYGWRDNQVGNIWVQPLDGSAPHALTQFTSDSIFDFSWSPGGKRLAVLRGHDVSDIILIRDTSATSASR